MPEHVAEPPVVLTENDARAGVTGHHVRHVLAFGLLGSVIAYVGIALYFGHRWVADTISDASGRIEPGLMARYATLGMLGLVAAALLIRLWDAVAGGSSRTSQRVMRLRVVLQLVAILLVVGAVFLSATY